MTLAPAKCPECGGNINIDSNKKAAICEFCKQPFIVEEAIKTFNIGYNQTIENPEQTSEELKNKFVFFHGKIEIDDYDTMHAMCKIMKEYYENCVKNNPDKIKYLLDYFSMVMKSYYLVLNNRCSSIYLEPKNKGVIELLFYLQKEIDYIDKNKGRMATQEINAFLEKLNGYILNNDDPCIGSSYPLDMDKVTKNTLIYAYINSKYAENKHSELALMRKIMKAEKGAPFGINVVPNGEAIWGHYYTHYDNWDGARHYLGKLEESFTNAKDLKKYCCRKTNEYLEKCKQQRICYICEKPISLFGKCRNSHGKMFNMKLY